MPMESGPLSSLLPPPPPPALEDPPHAVRASARAAPVAASLRGVAVHLRRARVLRLHCCAIEAPVRSPGCRNRLRRVAAILCGGPHTCQVTPHKRDQTAASGAGRRTGGSRPNAPFPAGLPLFRVLRRRGRPVRGRARVVSTERATGAAALAARRRVRRSLDRPARQTVAD